MRALASTQTALKTLIGFWMAATLFACTSYPDVNRDPAKNNKVNFQQDAIDCAQSYPEAGSGVHIRQRIGCMNLKGWY
jgi:hypothetical protein